MFGAISGFDSARESVVIAETVVVADADYFVELVADCVVAEECERIHGKEDRWLLRIWKLCCV